MPTEHPIRHLFDTPQPEAAIDVATVIRRSRARRVPKALGAGGISALAVAGLFFGGVQLAGLPQVASQSDAAGSSMEQAPMLDADGSDGYASVKRAPAERLNLCAGAVAEVPPSATGLELSLSFPDADAGSAVVEGTVSITNTGSQTRSGYTAATPTITLSQNGVVIWHSNGPQTQVAREVSLAPGESMLYTASFTPVVCGPEDDLEEGFRSDLPAAPAGEYQVSAAIDLLGNGDAELVTGPAQTVTLR